MKEISIVSDREEAKTRRKEDLLLKERFRRRMEEEVKIEEMKMEMMKKGFEFSRDEVVIPDEKVSVKLPKLKNLREQPLTGFGFGISLKLKSIKFQ